MTAKLSEHLINNFAILAAIVKCDYASLRRIEIDHDRADIASFVKVTGLLSDEEYDMLKSNFIVPKGRYRWIVISNFYFWLKARDEIKAYLDEYCLGAVIEGATITFNNDEDRLAFLMKWQSV